MSDLTDERKREITEELAKWLGRPFRRKPPMYPPSKTGIPWWYHPSNERERKQKGKPC